MRESAIQKAKEDVLWGVQVMVQRGYTLGTAGNISARVEGEDLFVITPSSRSYATLKQEDLCVVDMAGNLVQAVHKPSVETTMHRYLFLLRPEVNAVIHTHAKYATLVATLEGVESLPIIDIESVSYLGGETPIAPFHPAGSPELAEAVRDAIGSSAGLLMQNHGAIGVGTSMEKAMIVNDNIERTCEQYLWMLATGRTGKQMPQPYIDQVKALSLQSRQVTK